MALNSIFENFSTASHSNGLAEAKILPHFL
jgi:hypothetical protein